MEQTTLKPCDSNYLVLKNEIAKKLNFENSFAPKLASNTLELGVIQKLRGQKEEGVSRKPTLGHVTKGISIK